MNSLKRQRERGVPNFWSFPLFHPNLVWGHKTPRIHLSRIASLRKVKPVSAKFGIYSLSQLESGSVSVSNDVATRICVFARRGRSGECRGGLVKFSRTQEKQNK